MAIKNISEYKNTAKLAKIEATKPLPASKMPKDKPCLLSPTILVALIKALQQKSIEVIPQYP